jgi:hypothetical protein
MDAVLIQALQQVEDAIQAGLRSGDSNELPTAAVEFAQAAFSLGMQTGHFRAVLGKSYPSSPEAAAIMSMAARMNEAIVVAFTDEEEDEDEDEDEDEHPKQPDAFGYGYSPPADEDE